MIHGRSSTRLTYHLIISQLKFDGLLSIALELESARLNVLNTLPQNFVAPSDALLRLVTSNQLCASILEDSALLTNGFTASITQTSSIPNANMKDYTPCQPPSLISTDNHINIEACQNSDTTILTKCKTRRPKPSSICNGSLDTIDSAIEASHVIISEQLNSVKIEPESKSYNSVPKSENEDSDSSDSLYSNDKRGPPDPLHKAIYSMELSEPLYKHSQATSSRGRSRATRKRHSPTEDKTPPDTDSYDQQPTGSPHYQGFQTAVPSACTLPVKGIGGPKEHNKLQKTTSTLPPDHKSDDAKMKINSFSKYREYGDSASKLHNIYNPKESLEFCKTQEPSDVKINSVSPIPIQITDQPGASGVTFRDYGDPEQFANHAGPYVSTAEETQSNEAAPERRWDHVIDAPELLSLNRDEKLAIIDILKEGFKTQRTLGRRIKDVVNHTKIYSVEEILFAVFGDQVVEFIEFGKVTAFGNEQLCLKEKYLQLCFEDLIANVFCAV